jgi:hypothetical protein
MSKAETCTVFARYGELRAASLPRVRVWWAGAAARRPITFGKSRPRARRRSRAIAAPVRVDAQTEAMPAVDRREKSALGRALSDRQFVVVADVSAPRGVDLGATIAQANGFTISARSP